MLNIPVTQLITASIAPCPYCGTHESPEDRDGLLSCPNCGYPLAQDIPLIDDWASVLSQPAALDEASWAQLLAQAEREAT
jgi:hypothetical protein